MTIELIEKLSIYLSSLHEGISSPFAVFRYFLTLLSRKNLLIESSKKIVKIIASETMASI